MFSLSTCLLVYTLLSIHPEPSTHGHGGGGGRAGRREAAKGVTSRDRKKEVAGGCETDTDWIRGDERSIQRWRQKQTHRQRWGIGEEETNEG